MVAYHWVYDLYITCGLTAKRPGSAICYDTAFIFYL